MDKIDIKEAINILSLRRQNAIGTLGSLPREANYTAKNVLADEISAYDMAIKALKESDRETGKWIYQKDGKVTCSACGAEASHHGEEIDGEYKTFYYPTPFCPCCGAKLGIGDERTGTPLTEKARVL